MEKDKFKNYLLTYNTLRKIVYDNNFKLYIKNLAAHFYNFAAHKSAAAPRLRNTAVEEPIPSMC